MKLLLQVIMVAILGCTSTKEVVQVAKPNTENINVNCEDYIFFLKSQWEKRDRFAYQLKGNPEYWKEFNTYTKVECMIGNSKAEIEDIFGKPTKQFIFPSQAIWIYCMNEECVNSFLKYKPVKELSISFNEKEVVKSFGFNPYFSIKE